MSKSNYRVLLSFDSERKIFIARVPELEHCTAEGATRGEAIGKVEEEIAAQLQNMQAHGSNPPTAVDEEVFSGEIAAKVSKVLHRDLAWQARTEGVDLDQLVGELLAAALEGRKGARSHRGGNRQSSEHVPHDGIGNSIGGDRGGGRPRGGYGPRYNPMLDDRANFIEYVRGLEGGGHGNGPSRGPGGPAPGGPGGDRGGRGRRRRGRGGDRDQRNDRHMGGHPGNHGNGHNPQGGGNPGNGNPGNGSPGGNPGNGNPGNGNPGNG
jgi:predicted RNase H-like HicB family nuclease